MKIVIDVAAHEPTLATLQRRADCEIELIKPPEEKARDKAVHGQRRGVPALLEGPLSLEHRYDRGL